MPDRPIRSVLDPSRRGRLALPAIVLVSAWLAVATHRHGHATGDDFALYLRQARSVLDGDMAAVIADNRFAVVNSGPRFSPIGYPWGWPLLLAPFVRFWQLDYDRLKLVEVALWCVWLVWLHGIVRRRLGRPPALAVVAVLGTTPVYLVHTGSLLSEIPHLAVLGAFVAVLDRVVARGGLRRASSTELVALGLVATAVFEVRREGMVLVGVIAVAQAAEILASTRPGRRAHDALRSLRRDARALITPHAAFVGGVVAAQILMPTALLPDNDNSTSNIGARLSEYPRLLADQLGLGDRPALGAVILLTAAAGAVVGIRRRPLLDAPLLALAVLTTLTISTHFREVGRYWFQVTPWVLYFATVAVTAAGGALARALAPERDVGRGRARAALGAIGLVPLAVIVAVHVPALGDEVSAARSFDERGGVLFGPADPQVAVIYEAVERLTPPDAIVAHFKSRTMTLLTDRRSFQGNGIDAIARGADYFAQRRTPWGSQPDVGEAVEAGFVEVWSDDLWILWAVDGDATSIGEG